MSRLARFTLAVAMVGIPVVAQAQAQAAPPAGSPAQAPPAKKQPTAKTKAEYDDYQKFWTASDADLKIKSAEEFMQKYPDSELKIYALTAELASYQVKNDFVHLRTMGERILELDPTDLPTLLVLATAIPERTRENDLDKEQKWTAAEDYAKRALAHIDKMEKPAGVADAAWTENTNDARSQAHYSLGMVASQRKNYQVAVDELGQAAKLQSPSQPDPILWWRLALARQNNKQYDDAMAAFDKSISLGGVKLSGKDLASDDRDRLKKFMDSQKTAKP